MQNTPAPVSQARRALYWRRVRRLTLQLLATWFLVTFGVIYFARELSAFTLFGWPFSFYMAAQGVVIIYVLIIAAYVRCMQHLDKILKGDGNHGA